MKIAIIGAGFSGCYLYNKLKKQNHQVTIFEKSRGTGGRLSTKYIDEYFCDYGTSSFEIKNSDFLLFCAHLEKNGLLKKQKNRFFPTKGINKICSSLIDKKDLKTNTKIISCQRLLDKWQLQDSDYNTFLEYDFLFITIPAPQILELEIDLDAYTKARLKEVKYNSIATLILHSNHKIDLSQNIYESQFFKKIIDNSLNYEYKDFHSLVLHVNETFSTSNNYKSKEQFQIEILKYIEYFQNKALDESIIQIPHLWKYATVKQNIKDKYFYLEKEKLSICGDYFNGNNLEASFLSVNNFFKESNL